MKIIQILFSISTAICLTIILFIFSCDNSSKTSGDDPPESLICENGEVRSCGSDIGLCAKGTQSCVDGVWGDCEGEIESSTEECDGLDDDCDGLIDEDFNIGDSCLTAEGPCGAGLVECSGLDEPATVCSTEYGGSAFIGSELECGDSILGTTEGKSSLAESYTGCTNRIVWPGNESVYAFQCLANTDVTVSLTELTEDLDLLVLGSDCSASGCMEYSALSRTSSETVDFTATAGNTYYIIVDSQYEYVTSSYRISVDCD